MHSLVNQAKTSRAAEEDRVIGNQEKSKDASKKKMDDGSKTVVAVKEQGHLGFVKVNIDGIAIGRKVDLNAHSCYEALAQTLEDMFFHPNINVNLHGEFSFFSVFNLQHVTKYTAFCFFIFLSHKLESGS